MFGYLNTTSFLISTGGVVIGNANAATGVVQSGGAVMGSGNTVDGSGVLENGSCMIGRNNLKTGTSQGSAIGHQFADVTTVFTRFHVSVGGGVQGSGDYYNASYPSSTYISDAVVPASGVSLHLVAENTYLASKPSGETRFRNTRPFCDEGSMPTTDPDHLASKFYVDTVAGASVYRVERADNGSQVFPYGGPTPIVFALTTTSLGSTGFTYSAGTFTFTGTGTRAFEFSVYFSMFADVTATGTNINVIPRVNGLLPTNYPLYQITNIIATTTSQVSTHQFNFVIDLTSGDDVYIGVGITGDATPVISSLNRQILVKNLN